MFKGNYIISKDEKAVRIGRPFLFFAFVSSLIFLNWAVIFDIAESRSGGVFLV
jgi:hypothetical protein